MRKTLRFFLIAIPMIFGVAVNVYAWRPERTFQYEVRLGYSSAFQDILPHLPDYRYRVVNSIDDVYADRRSSVFSTNVFTGEFTFIVKKWLSFSINLTTGKCWNDVMSYYADSKMYRRSGTDSEWNIGVLPDARFTFLNRPAVKLYGSVGLGLLTTVSNTTTEGGGRRLTNITNEPAIQITPFGIMFGKRFFGYSELSFGNLFFGPRIGIGYRF